MKLFTKLAGVSFALLMSMGQVQAQCPDCTIILPPMPADTVYLDSVPDGQKNQYYEQNVSFRLPLTTAPLRALDPSVPATTVSLNNFTILGITGLPLGMTYKLDRPLPAVYNETSPNTRDGCVTICGTPIQSDSFTIIISVTVDAGFFGINPASIPIRFYVAPDTGAAVSFTPATGCVPLEVEFTTNTLPQGPQTAQYLWTFGDGATSDQANPVHTYSDTGTFEINYLSVYSVEVPRTLLTSVSVTQAPCNDNVFGIPGAPDIFLAIGELNGPIDTTTTFVNNQTPSTAAPVVHNFSPGIQLRANTTYYIDAKDDDAIAGGLPGPADCGILTFNSDTLAGQASPINLTLTNGSLTMIVRLERDTQYIRDTARATEFVYADPCLPPIAVTQVEKVEQSLKVFPNPTTGLLNVRFDLGEAESQEVEIRVLDMMGREVRNFQLGWQTGEYNGQFNLQDLSKGMYLLQVQSGQQRSFRKLILQ